MSARDELARAFKAAVFDKTEWRPVSSIPPERTVSIVCNDVRTAAAMFQDGKWVNAKGKPLTFEPTAWLDFRK